ncbi:MAG: threonine synthase [Xylanivirga thermophila]|jgi:threonine synthase|uniref:threonine synthase n=1 Tax=Xylanivirga thermophila TaxID=2496273 RepID=UPI00101D67D3|nr:threonine synthase [Xylanivirga thermophila]
MIYESTRDKDNKVSSMEAIKQGISPEGGLYVPEYIPNIDGKLLKDMVEMNYREKAIKILSMYLDDYDKVDINRCVDKAYSKIKFDSEDIAPIEPVGDNLFALELWHGPTCAFKDIALQLLPHLMTTAVQRTNEQNKLAILTATSGDTGTAALSGFSDVKNTYIVVFYPQDGVSAIQKMQMITQPGLNTHVIGIQGNFDDAQSGVKSIFTNKKIRSSMEHLGYRLSSANSINWGRLVPQIIYYFSSYLDMVKHGWIIYGQPINVVVPTGNFGNILAAYYAKSMGLPINKLICASNTNNVLTEFINTGRYDVQRKFHKTISPSMDILISSNLERLLFEISGRNTEYIQRYMQKLKEDKVYKIDDNILSSIKNVFWAGYATEEQTIGSIKQVYEKYGYVMDPHTAVGYYVYDEYKKITGDSTKTIIACTASPFKFCKPVLNAILGSQALEQNGNEFDMLEKLSQVSGSSIPCSLINLKDKQIIHKDICEKYQMESKILSIFKRMG